MKIVLIDGNNYLNRAYYAVKYSKEKGKYLTVRSFMNMVISDTKRLGATHLIVTFDKGGKRKTWRQNLLPEYKANRRAVYEKTDEKSLERVEDFKKMRDLGKKCRILLKACGIPVVMRSKVEADDFIGTIAQEYEEKGFDVVICSNDKDFNQLITKNIKVMSANKDILGIKEIKVKYGIKPSQFLDYLTLLGDKVDGVPGVRGCGEKTGSALLTQFKSLSGIYENIDELKPSIKKTLLAHKKQVRITKKVLRIKTDVPHNVSKSEAAFPNKRFDEQEVKKQCKKMEMKATLSMLLRRAKP